MSPNGSQKPYVPLWRSRQSETNNKPSAGVSMDRLYEIARQLAELELSQEVLVDNCVSLLEEMPSHTEPVADDPITRRYGNLVGPPPPPVNGQSAKGEKNYCEVVSVPTSTHVAQIVGKQGSKIKLLRAKSKTYIQTPVSGEEPVFIITGRREDVLKVKAEILSASEHFSSISEERQMKFKQNCDIPGGMTVHLHVPSFLIGLIVGKNGQTIRNLQLTTETSVETPKTNDQSFKISGLMHNCFLARDQIIEHVKAKTQRQFRITVQANGDTTIGLIGSNH